MKKFRHLVALVLVVMIMLSMMPAQASVGAISGNNNKNKTTTVSTNAESFTIEPIDWDGAVLGQYALPAGYTANRMINNCDENSTLGHPIRVSVALSSKDDDARMMYYCGEDFLDRVYSSNSITQHKEGKIDAQTMSFMRRYQNADEYCDALAHEWVPNAVFYKSEDVSSCDARLAQRESMIQNEVVPGLATYGMKVEWIEATAAKRVYTYETDGKKYCICVMAEDYAYQYSSNAYGFSITNIVWQVPNYYILWCPFESYETLRDGAFSSFVDNTSINDEMMALNDKLTEDIAEKVVREMNMVCAASMSYMATMTALTFSMVESSMASSRVYTGSYSSDRFSDYMFDQNDYTLSDGSSVKISTGFDYVWEGSNGTVYYGNSLSDAPGGATQLYPNH